MSRKGLGRKNPLISAQNLNYSEKLINSGIFGDNFKDKIQNEYYLITVYELGLFKGYIKSINKELKGLEIVSNVYFANQYRSLSCCQDDIKFLMQNTQTNDNYYGYCIEERLSYGKTNSKVAAS